MRKRTARLCVRWQLPGLLIFNAAAGYVEVFHFLFDAFVVWLKRNLHRREHFAFFH
jgi:hypothetical protein